MLINYITKYRMKKILLLLFMLTLTMATFSQSKTSKQKYDTEYWDSVNREKRLKLKKPKAFCNYLVKD